MRRRRRSSGLQIPWESTSLEEDFWLGLKRWMAPDKCRRPIVIESFRRIEGGVIETRKKLAKAGTFAENGRLELAAFKQS